MKKLYFVLFLSFSIFAEEVLTESWQKRINQVLSGTLTRYHYVDQSIDDNYSKRVFELFLNQLDPNKNFFTQEQMAELNAYEYKIDNDIRNNTFNFYNLALLRIKQQIEFSHAIQNTLLEYPMNLDDPIRMELDAEKKEYATTNNELTQRWKANTQYQVAQNYITLYKEKYPSKNTLIIEEPLVKNAIKKTKKELARQFKRLMNKSDNDYFTAYLDSITRAFGPHTTYLPPAEKEDFDINMSGQLEGIGAILREDDGQIKVVRIIPGSASWREGSLKAEDIILKVAQNNNIDEAVSISETPVREAVKLIRGPKGSTVNLIVKKPDGMIKTISIQRDIVVIKSAYAKSGIFKVNQASFGYINLPSFYRDFENNNNRNAAGDIKKALLEFNKQNTAGMILDLRNNGGGSLQDAVEISGFFIPEGPVVQVSNSYNQKETYTDRDKQTIYSQPVVILVNTFSASASEIVSAALQDYKRAIILGNSHTFGKGTVQKVVNLDSLLFKSTDPLGFLKITIQEYFRITGTSTQFTGVIPDIIYPSPYDYLDVGEKELTYAFEGSTTSSSIFQKWQDQKQRSFVIEESYKRLNQSPASKTLIDYNQFMKNQRNNSNRSIRISDLWENMEKVKAKNKTLEDITVKKQFESYTSIEPNPKDHDESEAKDYQKWVDGFNKDVLLNEAFQVLTQINQPIVKNE
ncbi:MAG: carboxy terminal-processing peptidase [Candidatus Margulisiibacteriota bacterium]